MRYLTAGESHGPRLTAIIEGIPAGLPLTVEDINEDLKRRLLRTLKTDLKASGKSLILVQDMPIWLGASSTVLTICEILWSVHQLVKQPCE